MPRLTIIVVILLVLAIVLSVALLDQTLAGPDAIKINRPGQPAWTWEIESGDNPPVEQKSVIIELVATEETAR